MAGFVGRLVGVVFLLLGGLVVVGVFLYAIDFGVEATVTEKDCRASPPVVSVVTKVVRIGHEVEVDPQQCGVIEPGNFVRYHVRSQRTIIFQAEGGSCIWDTTIGPCAGGLNSASPP